MLSSVTIIAMVKIERQEIFKALKFGKKYKANSSTYINYINIDC